MKTKKGAGNAQRKELQWKIKVEPVKSEKRISLKSSDSSGQSAQSKDG